MPKEGPHGEVHSILRDEPLRHEDHWGWQEMACCCLRTKGLAYNVLWTFWEAYGHLLHTSSYETKGGSRRQVLTRDMGVNMNKDAHGVTICPMNQEVRPSWGQLYVYPTQVECQ